MSNSCDPMDCSLPGSSVQGISQATILEWVPIPSPGDLPASPALQVGSLPTEPPGNALNSHKHMRKQLLSSMPYLKKLKHQEIKFSPKVTQLVKGGAHIQTQVRAQAPAPTSTLCWTLPKPTPVPPRAHQVPWCPVSLEWPWKAPGKSGERGLREKGNI